MKYKVCKFQDGNGLEWYQIKIKGWVFWRNVYVYHGPDFGCHGYKIPLKFSTFEKAKEWVDRELANYNWIKNSKQQKIVECVEI